MPPQNGHSYFWKSSPKQWHDSFRDPAQNHYAHNLGGFNVVTPLPSGAKNEVFIPHSALIPLIDQRPLESIRKLTEEYGIPQEDAAGLIMQEEVRLQFHHDFYEHTASQAHDARDTLRKAESSSYFDTPAAWTAFVQTVSQFPHVSYRTQVEISIQSRQRGSVSQRLVTPEFLDATGITPPPKHQAFTLGIERTPEESTSRYFESFSYQPYFAWDDVVNGVELETPPKFEPTESGRQWPHTIEKEQTELDASSKSFGLGTMLLAELKQLGVPIIEKSRREYLETAYATGYNPDATLALSRDNGQFSLIVPRPKNVFATVDELSLFDTPTKMLSLVTAYSEVAASRLDRVNQSESSPLSTALGYVLLSPLMKNPRPYRFRAPGLQIQGGYESFARQFSAAAAYLDGKLQNTYGQLAQENGLAKAPMKAAATAAAFSDYLATNEDDIAKINSRTTLGQSQADPIEHTVSRFFSEKLTSLSNPNRTIQSIESMAPTARLGLQQQSRSERGQHNPENNTAKQHHGQEQPEETEAQELL
ncbi:hypothetical protein NQ042_13250 [Corynebacterium phoceense]|uniref:hypothetical protein n=1 Tax=Corynebacterium phoceense TaxID=1686286 RepID=UPI00211B9783|nr:hypothetical protein [Corynebacterium phoceense]MCQ9335026.1 hypothetical protein [Corynebacterium phoceense]